jgi:uncharacterized RDD family membrane protein YckC
VSIRSDTSAPAGTPGALQAMTPPGFWRRMAAMLYEGVLLFGVLMIAGLLYSAITQQRHALQGRIGMQAFLFLVLGAYFVWFWSHGGQTVAMKTWHVRIVDATGEPVGRLRAMARYLLAWLWFVPALVVCGLAGWHTSGALSAALVVGVLVYAMLTHWLPGRQTPHDLACGTRVIHQRPAPR